MVTMFNAVLQVIRDAVVVFASALIMYANYGLLSEEGARFLLGGASMFFVLTVVNEILLFRKVKRKSYFYINAVIQVIPSIFLTFFGLWIGPVLLVLNVAVVFTLVFEPKKQDY